MARGWRVLIDSSWPPLFPLSFQNSSTLWLLQAQTLQHELCRPFTICPQFVYQLHLHQSLSLSLKPAIPNFLPFIKHSSLLMFLQFGTCYSTHLKCFRAIPPLYPSGRFPSVLKTLIKCPCLSSLCFPNTLYAHTLNTSCYSDLPICLLRFGKVCSSSETNMKLGIMGT